MEKYYGQIRRWMPYITLLHAFRPGKGLEMLVHGFRKS
jgi:hypothetical protein